MKAAARFFLAIGLFCCPFFPLAAQESPAAPPPDEFEVYQMGQVTVAAEAPPAEVAQVTVVTAEEIKANNARTVAEALFGTPGIRLSTGRKNEPNVSIHGFDQAKVLVLIDGVPYYETNYGKLDLNQIPTDNIARIEVTKGAASVLYGANALGGVINIVTRQAGERPFTGAALEFGDDNLDRYSLTHGRKAGKINYWLNYTQFKSDGWDVSGDYKPTLGKITRRSPNSTTPAVLQGEKRRLNSDRHNAGAWFKIGYENGPDSAYWFNLHSLNMDKGSPPATDQVTVFQSRPQFSQFARIKNYRDQGIDFDMRERLGRRLVLKGKLFYHDHQDDYDSYDDQTFRRKLARSTFKDYLAGGSLILESPLAESNTLRLAVNYKIDSHRERDDTYLPFARTRSTTSSWGLEDEIRIGEKVKGVVGVSYDRFEVGSAERNILDKSGNFLRQDPLPEPSNNYLSPMAGLTWQVGEQSHIFLAAARKSRFPLLQNLFSSRSGNLDLRPERTTNYIAGYNGVVASRLRLEGSAFWYNTTDLINRSGVDPNNLFQNYGKVRTRGLEVAAVYFASPELTLRADLTLLDAEDKSNGRITDKVINIPRRLAGVGISWRLPWLPIRIDLSGTHAGEVYTSLPSPRYPTDPTYKVDEYFLTSLRAGVDLGSKFELWLAVRNLGDQDYETDYAFPGPGRAFSVGLKARM